MKWQTSLEMVSKFARRVAIIASLALFLTVTQGAVNVRDFGAKGDGKADDAKAIASAIEAAKAAGGGSVEFPEGDYLLDVPPQPGAFLHLPSGVSLIGHGRARLLSSKDTTPLLMAVGVQDVRIDSLRFQSPGRAFYCTERAAASSCLISPRTRLGTKRACR